MDVFDGFESFTPRGGATALAIGNFDGFHRGHQRIVAVLHDHARRLRVTPAVLTFEPHPLAVVAPQRAPALLTTLAEKLAYLRAAGVAQCVVLRSTPALLAQSATDFLDDMVARCRPRAIVEGHDFNFGRGRGGSIETLRAQAAELGYEVEVVAPVRLPDESEAGVVSSTAVRRAIAAGAVGVARELLGRLYRIVGTVTSGDERGATLGFPTANLAALRQLVPGHGVYAAVAQGADDSLHLAAVNVGPQPTFGQAQARIEAHLLDFAGTLGGQRLGLHFSERLRGQARFDGPAALVAQIGRDVAATRAHAAALEALRSAGVIPLAWD